MVWEVELGDELPILQDSPCSDKTSWQIGLDNELPFQNDSPYLNIDISKNALYIFNSVNYALKIRGSYTVDTSPPRQEYLQYPISPGLGVVRICPDTVFGRKREFKKGRKTHFVLTGIQLYHRLMVIQLNPRDKVVGVLHQHMTPPSLQLLCKATIVCSIKGAPHERILAFLLKTQSLPPSLAYDIGLIKVELINAVTIFNVLPSSFKPCYACSHFTRYFHRLHSHDDQFLLDKETILQWSKRITSKNYVSFPNSIEQEDDIWV